MDKTFKDFLPLEEGVNDPAIFKAVFLAGGPGSGKSFVVGQTALSTFGLKTINSDDAFENALKKAGVMQSYSSRRDPAKKAITDFISSPKGQAMRDRAKYITNKRQDQYIEGRLGLVIDGTGKDYAKIEKQKNALETLGYQTMMIFVNADRETARKRNANRARTIDNVSLGFMWKETQKNIGKFQNLFGNDFVIIDNSEGSDYQSGIMHAYRKVGRWVKTSHNYIAQRWIRDQKQQRGIREDLRNWFSKDHPKGDWVRVGTDGEIKGQCAREPGEGKPKCMPRQKAHSMDKDDRATSARRKRRKDPVADRKGKGGKPIMVKTDVKEAAKLSAAERLNRRLKTHHGIDLEARQKFYTDMIKKMKDTSAKAVDSSKTQKETFQWMKDPLAKTVHRVHYNTALKTLKPIIDRKKREGGGKLKHGIEYYAAQVARTISDKVDARTLAKMYQKEDKQISRYEWGRPEGTQYFKALTPGEPGSTTKKNQTTNKYHYKTKIEEGENHSWKTDGHYKKDGTEWKGDQHAHDGQVMTGKKHTKDSENLYHFKDLGQKARQMVLDKLKIKEHCGCEEEMEVLEMDVDSIFTSEDIADMEVQIDNMDFDEMIGLGMYDSEELEDFDSAEEDDDEESDIHDNVDILEALSIQGRMKRRFNARRNRQKLKVARMRASRRAADPARVKRRATRGARNMIKSRLARGRDMSSMPPAEKARIEAMSKRFTGLISRLAQRMVPIIRKNELKRLTSTNKKPQKAKKYKASSAKSSASAQKAKKFKVKKK